MRIPFKFLPRLFNTLYFTEQSNLDVADPPSVDAGTVSADSSTATETSTAQTEQPSGDVKAGDGATAGTEVADDPLAGIPTLEEAQKLMEQNVPNAEAVVRLRTALNERDERYKPLEPWQPLAEKNLDPSLLSSAYEMVSAIHSPVEGQPNQFTTVPFLQQLETDSPGTTDQLFSDMLQFQVPGENGKPDTLVRQLVRSWGLDPDRIEDYRTIDARVPSSGFVTPDQLVGIDPKFHDAFKALSQAQREDILAQKQADNTYPQAALEYLSDKAEALEARKFREQFQQQEQQRQQAEQQRFESETQAAVQQDISSVVETMHDSIQKRLSSKVTLSSDEVINEIEHAKIMGSLFSLLDPGLRKATTKALERAGTPLDLKFDGLVSALEAERTAVVRHTRHGDKLQAGQAQSRANLAQNQLLAMLENYAMALAQPSANRLQADSQNLVASLNGATARHVPNGNALPQAGGNPFELPAGIQPFSEEARAFRAQVERQMRP